MIAIVDYGVGNLGSIRNMLKRVGLRCKLACTGDELEDASKIILPGVAAFDYAMEKLNRSGLLDVLTHKACVEKVPTLGICVGMQMLTRGSEEGRLPGLGWIPGATKRFSCPGRRIPHMGWNSVRSGSPSLLTADFDEQFRFYFVHSYRVTVDDPRHAILTCDYGETFDAAIQLGNLFGVQFHPEKSHRFGKQLFLNFSTA